MFKFETNFKLGRVHTLARCNLNDPSLSCLFFPAFPPPHSASPSTTATLNIAPHRGVLKWVLCRECQCTRPLQLELPSRNT